MKKLTLFIVISLMTLNIYSQGLSIDFVNKSGFATFTADQDNSWDIKTTAAYEYEWVIKWTNLSALDSYMEIYLGSDPDEDGTTDWNRDNNLDRLALSSTSGVSRIQNLSGGTISKNLRLFYNHGSVGSGTIWIELNLVSKPTDKDL